MTDLTQQPVLPTYPQASNQTITPYWANQLVRLLGIRDRGVNNAIRVLKLEGSFTIDSTGLKTVTINTVIPWTIQDNEQAQVSVAEETAVDDWAYDLLKVVSVSATSVVVKINVSSASATGSATAKVVVWVRG